MSDNQGSTVNHEDEWKRFHVHPVGFTVRLEDGSEAVVGGFKDTPRGRWLRLRRRGGPWVREYDIVGLVVYSVGLRGAAAGPARVSA